MAHVRPFWTSTLQDLFNDTKNASMQGALTLAIVLWVFKSPGRLTSPIFGSVSGDLTTPSKWGCDTLVVIYCDNISIILLANNPVYHARTKHIEVHYHFIREKVLAKKINLIHVSIEDQVVNIFTKALGIDKLKRFKKMLCVLEMDLSLRGSVENSSSIN